MTKDSSACTVFSIRGIAINCGSSAGDASIEAPLASIMCAKGVYPSALEKLSGKLFKFLMLKCHISYMFCTVTYVEQYFI